ncbi:MAG: methyltransferase domain-containing protein [Psychromonas sp.]|nr:methyltransferase domain-containing protein [Psychromonas sp.]
MKIAKTARILPPLESWQQLPYGMDLLAQTQERIRQYLPRAFGYHLLKIGHLSSAIDTSESTILHQINCAPSGNKIGLFADFKDLPLKKSSIDLCILAHELDFSNDPHQLLREIQRVLTLDGILIISGYNPISYFGLRSLFRSKKQQTARLFSPNRVIDWLHLLGFEIQQKQHFGFLSGYNPSKNKGYISACIEKFGLRYCPVFCSVYFLVAKKQSVPMRPIITPFTFTKKTIIGGQAAATRNSASKSSHTIPL